MSTVIVDATGRELVVEAGEVGGEPVALVAVRSANDARTAVTLWLCPAQMNELSVAMWQAFWEAREAVKR